MGQTIKHKKKQRKAFHIRIVVTPLDAGLWEAKMPKTLPHFLYSAFGRSVLIKGPLRDFWFRNIAHYHRVRNCKITADAHQASQTEIDADQLGARKWAYWLVVFPPGTVLDNTVFSDHKSDVVMNKVPMKAPLGTGTLSGMALNWVIAIDYSRDLGGEAAEQIDYDDMFNF